MAEAKAKVTPIIVEDFEINAQNVTFQKLQEFTLTLFEKLLNHRKERNFLLLERDKLRTLLENTRHELKVARDTTLNQEELLEKVQEKHAVEKKEVDEEVKYILYSHGLNLAELKQWERNIMKKQQEINLEEEIELLQEKRSWKEKLEAGKMKNQEELENLKREHLEELTNLQKECEEAQSNYEMEFKNNFYDTIKHLNLKHKMEMSEVEERKNTHLVEIKNIHTSRVQEMKNFFNSVTAENLAIISSLKQSLDNVKSNKAVITEEVKILKQENENMKEPLEKSKYEVKNLKRQLFNYEKDLLSLKNNRKMLKEIVENTKKVRKQSNKIMSEIKECEDGDIVKKQNSHCLCSINNLKSCSKTKQQNLEEMIDFQIEDLKTKQKMIKELTFNPDVVQALKDLNFEYWCPKQLSHELAIICKAHDELLQCLEEKLGEFCLPKQSLGFKPVQMEYCGADLSHPGCSLLPLAGRSSPSHAN